MDISKAIEGWVPIKLVNDDGERNCRWLYVGNKHFNEPFFDETISACRQLPENGHLKRSISSIDLLQEWATRQQSIAPTAFIFHVSRCGSTLLSQMLSLQQSNIVLSEVPFFDDLLRYGKKENCLPQISPIVKAAIDLYSTKRNEAYNNVFIKTDSWHIHFYTELRTLYPTTPFFFLYRKPDEVVQSQQKKRGMQAIPNLIEANVFGFDKEEISTKPLDEYMGMVIESYLEKFYTILQEDKNCYALNYHTGAMDMIDTIAAKSALPITQEEYAAMQQRAGFHAKFPNQIFSEEKRIEAIPSYLKKSFALYDKIEELRIKSIDV
jgi:hypothetical protein